jgi:hypothetical protein
MYPERPIKIVIGVRMRVVVHDQMHWVGSVVTTSGLPCHWSLSPNTLYLIVVISRECKFLFAHYYQGQSLHMLYVACKH